MSLFPSLNKQLKEYCNWFEAKKPLTGEVIHLPFRLKPSFQDGKELRERVNKEMELMHEAEDLIRRFHVPEKAFEATMGSFALLCYNKF